MAILNVEWQEFVGFNNGLVVVDRILANYDYWIKMSEVLEKSYTHNITPEILSGRILRS